MEELKLILETVESLGNVGQNLFIIWVAKDIFKLVFISTGIFILGGYFIKTMREMVSSTNWASECKKSSIL